MNKSFKLSKLAQQLIRESLRSFRLKGPDYHGQTKTVGIISNFQKYGRPFAYCFFKRFGARQNRLASLSPWRGIDSIFCVESKEYSSHAHVSFERVADGQEVIIESFQGEFEGENLGKKSAIARPDLLLNELVQVAREGGYKRVKIRRPEHNLFFQETAIELKRMWLRKEKIRLLTELKMKPLEAARHLKDLVQQGYPTALQLVDIQREHQKRMVDLYYTVARKIGFHKKGEFLVRELTIGA